LAGGVEEVIVKIGARLGPYEIQSALGAGGMGEVYRARDTRLDRTVAIKILPDALAADSQFRDRFDREARTISQLDHPHICALYDVGEQTGTAYLVMQYLEGETLADRLTRGALPLDQALQVAIQIADALSAAHKAGIVHRDLKPGNMAVPINVDSPDRAPAIGSPVPLFAAHLSGSPQAPTVRSYSVSRDGQRFLMDVPVETSLPVTVILNWKPKP
jgi:serine/threonine protein kinase